MFIVAVSFLVIILLFYFFVADSQVFSLGRQTLLQRDAIHVKQDDVNGIAPPGVVMLTDRSSIADQQSAYENARALYASGNAPQALEQHQILLDFFPEDAQLRNNHANILRDLERFDEAVLEYRRVIEINHAFTPAYLNLVYLLQDLKRPDEALSVLEEGLVNDPRNPELLNIRANY